jgi:enoyl-CoA hydratase
MHAQWRNLSKPTIAMVQGYCIMGSWMVTAACDIIVYSEDARFTDQLVRRGGAHHEYPPLLLGLGPKEGQGATLGE